MPGGMGQYGRACGKYVIWAWGGIIYVALDENRSTREIVVILSLKTILFQPLKL